MLRARLTRADRWALGILVLLPIVVNVPWALAGHPVLDGDNLTQNYPLRVLAGQLLAHGRLPLWDPFIWSGVPLLAGWNAGAMFPGTWLFALLSPVSAYEANVVVTGIVCGVGFFLFLRRSACSPLAAFLGALTWSEMGFLSGQVVHLGLVEGTALAPWILLAIDGLFRSARSHAGAGYWVALLGVCGGLVVLAGDPRAVSNDAIIAVVYLAARCWRERDLVTHALAGAAAGVALAVAIGAAQWLPGLSYLHSSQRSASTLGLFGYYSLGWSDLPLLAVPFLIGGNGNYGMPFYAGPLNLPEVTYAVGILPLIAFFALLPKLFGQWRRKKRGGDSAQPLTVWYVMVVLGAVLTTGSRTPLGHLLVHLPLYGGQRDQNRNAAIADFALSALLAIFVDTLRAVPATVTSGYPGRRERLQRWFGVIPVVVVIGLIAAMYATTSPMERWLGLSTLQPGLPAHMTVYYVVAALIALAGGVVLVRRHWPSAESRRRAAAAVVVADALVFLLMASYQAVPESVLAPANAAESQLVSQLPAGSRIAFYDPAQLSLSRPAFLTDKLGVNDLVILHRLESVQGYGAAIPAAYDAATNTHSVEDLRASALKGTTFDDLDLGLVIVVPEQFGTLVPRGAPLPSATILSASTEDGGAHLPDGFHALGSAGFTWQLPAPTEISSVAMPFDPAGPLPQGSLTLSVQLADGGILRWQGHIRSPEATIPLSPSAVRAGGGALALTLRPDDPADTPVVGAAVVTADAASAPLAMTQPVKGEVRFVLDGTLQGILCPPHWVYAGREGPLVLYRNTRARGSAWLEAKGAGSPSAPSVGGSVRTLATPAWEDAAAVVDAKTPALLVRSVAYSPGWSATLQPLGPAGALGASSSRPVLRVGLLQGVEIPAGRFRLTWHYHSGRTEIGLALAAAGCLACGLLALAGLRSRRRWLQGAAR